MQRIRPGCRLAASLLFTLTALPAAATSIPEGPVCRADRPAASEPTVRVLTLDDLSPERAARIRERLARHRAGSAVIARDPNAPAAAGLPAEHLAALAQEQREAYQRLQATEPEMLSNGLYRLDVGRAFLTPLVALPTPDGGVSVEHLPAASANAPEVKP